MTPTIDAIRVGDPPAAWAAAGFHVDTDATVRIGTVRVECAGRDAGTGILEWSWRGLGPGDVDGLTTSESTAAGGVPAAHPNGVVAIDHVVVMTPDCDRTAGAFVARGLSVRRSRATDTYGAPMRQVFLRAGEVIVEIVGPQEPADDAPAAFFGLALTTADLDAAARLLGDGLGRVKDAVQPGRRIATVRHRDLGLSVPLALMSGGERAGSGSARAAP